MKNFLQLKKIINSHKISEDIKSYKLLDNAFSSDDILAGTKVLLSRQMNLLNL